MTPYYQDDLVTLYHGDCIEVMRTMPAESVDSIVTDPPYGLEFMGKEWDKFGRGEATSQAVAGMSGPGYTDGATRLERPSFMGGANPKCRGCGLWQRGGNPCACVAPDFPNERRARSSAFGAWCALWTSEALRVLKPGGHLLAFGGTRTWHRLAAAVEDAGFEMRDSIAWLYGSGFPKSLDVSKAIDKAAGVEPIDTGIRSARHGGGVVGAGSSYEVAPTVPNITAPATEAAQQWQGWGTALKPAFEPLVVARKPLRGTVAANVQQYGTGALNIDGCRIDAAGEAYSPTTYSGQNKFLLGGFDSVDKLRSAAINDDPTPDGKNRARAVLAKFESWSGKAVEQPSGRWPANVVLDEGQAAALDQQSGTGRSTRNRSSDGRTQQAGNHTYGGGHLGVRDQGNSYDDTGGASRYFYTAKADGGERITHNGVAHPTVKPLSLMRWLVRLVTPPGGAALEPFAGSGTTVEACILEGFRCVAVEREADYLPLIVQRVNRRRDPVAYLTTGGHDLGLFGPEDAA